MLRASVNDQYLQYQLSTADSSGSHSFQTTTTSYRAVMTVRQGSSIQHQGQNFNNLIQTSGSSAYYFDNLANMKIFGRFYLDVSWFAQTTMAGVNKSTDGAKPVLKVYQTGAASGSLNNLMWHEGVSMLNKSLDEITGATKWSGIRFYMTSGTINGNMRLMGRK